MRVGNTRLVWVDEPGRGDMPRVGGKNASLDLLVRTLAAQGASVSPVFATTKQAYWQYVEANRLGKIVDDALSEFKSGTASFKEAGQTIRRAFVRGDWPEETPQAFRRVYRELSKRSNVSATMTNAPSYVEETVAEQVFAPLLAISHRKSQAIDPGR